MDRSASWFRDIMADVIVTAGIVAAVLLAEPWMFYLVAIYTAFMLIIRVLHLYSNQLQAIVNKKKSAAPNWIYHLLYGLNILVLSWFSWYLIALGWAGIWALAVWSQKKKL